METLEDPAARLDLLTRTLSRMTAPYGYAVRFGWDGRSHAFLGMTDARGARAGYLCLVYSNFGSREAAEAEVVSQYGEYRSWTYWDVRRCGWLSVPGGSPEELALKDAAGVKAVLVSGRDVS